MFDFANDFISRTVVTARNGMMVIVLCLALWAGISKKSIVAFAVTALAGGIALWIASPAGINLFPNLFGEGVADLQNENDRVTTLDELDFATVTTSATIKRCLYNRQNVRYSDDNDANTYEGAKSGLDDADTRSPGDGWGDCES